MKKFFYSAFAASLLFAACRSAPDPEQSLPLPSLAFDGIQAESPDALALFFILELNNPLPSAGLVTVESWQVKVNGQAAYAGFSLEGAEGRFPVTPEAPASFPLTLNMDVAALIAEGLAPFDYYEVELIAELGFSCGREAVPKRLYVSGLAAFPGVRPPVFSIIDIAILQAELINTRFRVGIKIDNPNAFPLELSALGYTLFGNGRLWADGTERNAIPIPAKSSVEGSFLLLMNFMGMRRETLDQIINLVDVNYRFAGEAQVSTGVEFLPKFTTRFDLSGFSQVLER